jgi:hypothetical protein
MQQENFLFSSGHTEWVSAMVTLKSLFLYAEKIVSFVATRMRSSPDQFISPLLPPQEMH